MYKNIMLETYNPKESLFFVYAQLIKTNHIIINLISCINISFN